MEVYFDEYDEWREGFAKAAGIDLERATDKELAFLSRLMDVADKISCRDEHRYSIIVQTLAYARKQGKRIRIVTDREFWKNGSCRDQLDGWTYHLQMYKPRTAPVYYDSKGTIFDKSPVSFNKEIKGGKIWSVDTDEIGPLYITFDKKTIYNLFGDYPDNMTPEQVALVKKEMPYWAEFFEVRT